MVSGPCIHIYYYCLFSLTGKVDTWEFGKHMSVLPKKKKKKKKGFLGEGLKFERRTELVIYRVRVRFKSLVVQICKISCRLFQ